MIRIAVIDTGVDLTNTKFSQVCSKGLGFQIAKNEIVMVDSYQDEVGHGTAITNILMNSCKNIEVISIKVIGVNYYTDESVIIAALKYVLENIDCQIINMSLGLNTCARREELEEVIDRLNQRGTLIISAFNNDGSMSYPAIMKNVIGVDSLDESTSPDHYEFIENSEINVRGMGGNQRVLWLDGQYKVVKGSSFATAHITSIVANLLNANVKANKVLTELRNTASRIISAKTSQNCELSFNISKAIAFPYNKEMHSVVRFDNLLSFDLKGVYDIKQSGNLGKTIISEKGNRYSVQNVFKIDWESDFDTLIIGHINMLEKIINTDIRKYLMLKCKLHKKNIYSFDFISNDKTKAEYDLHIFSPFINSKMLPQNTFGKLYHIDKPVIGIFGTGSKQGKFTLQLILRKFFQNAGYKVGHIGTEPSSLLFGCERVYPMGYENSVDTKGFDSVSLLNKYMFDISKETEIIIVGSQANTVPPLMGNQCYYTTKQIEFLLGTQPDAVILCFNAHDDEEYIARTIKTIENIIETQVIAAVMFPLKMKEGWAGINGVMESVTECDRISFEQFYKEKFNIPMYLLDDKNDMENLYNDCIRYFSE